MECTRCQGRMIKDSFVDLQDDTGQMTFNGWRCLNCGELVDPIVLNHRIEPPTNPYRGKTRDRRLWERLTSEQAAPNAA